ncbi:unnamed protein product [Chironomus riparius]|uniref:LITAF domain-containing protein n=1 Tax=Chironomus riparius TaxID=315576 RepID=A0A9N9WS09_9DIPT|nr:unnamed protein product [Chironomus riparius]
MSQYQPPITTQPTSITIVNAPPILGPNPQAMTCPVCQAQIMTDVSDKAIAKTHGFAILICCLGGVLGCCLIPYCCSSCQGQEHACPNCRHSLGFYK